MPQFLGQPQGAVAGMGQGVIWYRRFHLRRHAVGMGAARAGQTVGQAVRPKGPIVPRIS